MVAICLKESPSASPGTAGGVPGGTAGGGGLAGGGFPGGGSAGGGSTVSPDPGIGIVTSPSTNAWPTASCKVVSWASP